MNLPGATGHGGFVVGHGVDIVDVARVAGTIAEHGDRFVRRCFTVQERAYIDSIGQGPRAQERRVERAAVRFAAKEAVMKALGVGLESLPWVSIEVGHEPGGRPVVRLSGVAAGLANRQGVAGWSLSLSHTSTIAMASAIAFGREQPGAGRGSAGV